MNCFTHPLADAVGICKHCSRGLCMDCATDQGYGLACKNRCEDEVKAVQQIIERSKAVHQRTAGAYQRAAILYGLMAALFLGFPFVFRDTPIELRYLFLGMGGLMVLGAILNLFNASRTNQS